MFLFCLLGGHFNQHFLSDLTVLLPAILRVSSSSKLGMSGFKFYSLVIKATFVQHLLLSIIFSFILLFFIIYYLLLTVLRCLLDIMEMSALGYKVT